MTRKKNTKISDYIHVHVYQYLLLWKSSAQRTNTITPAIFFLLKCDISLSYLFLIFFSWGQFQGPEVYFQNSRTKTMGFVDWQEGFKPQAVDQHDQGGEAFLQEMEDHIC